jgi:hypothetical protein
MRFGLLSHLPPTLRFRLTFWNTPPAMPTCSEIGSDKQSNEIGGVTEVASKTVTPESSHFLRRCRFDGRVNTSIC